jgi:hypothetical protein
VVAPLSTSAVGEIRFPSLSSLSPTAVANDSDALIAEVISPDAVIENRLTPPHDDEPAHRHGQGNKPPGRGPRNEKPQRR